MKYLFLIIILLLAFTPIFGQEVINLDFKPSQMYFGGVSTAMTFKGIGTILLITAAMVGLCIWGSQFS